MYCVSYYYDVKNVLNRLPSAFNRLIHEYHQENDTCLVALEVPLQLSIEIV